MTAGIVDLNVTHLGPVKVRLESSTHLWTLPGPREDCTRNILCIIVFDEVCVLRSPRSTSPSCLELSKHQTDVATVTLYKLKF